jgi:hypothetical protein
MHVSKRAAGLLAIVAGVAVSTGSAPAEIHAQPATIAPLTANASFDYQIGGGRTQSGVRVVSRDRNDAPAAGLYNICYINAFQSQPDRSAEDGWRSKRLLLTDRHGHEVKDADWDEYLLDITTAAKRQAVAAKVNEWIDDCAAKGFQAVEPDNIDSFTRSAGRIGVDDAVAYLKLLIKRAHHDGLAIAQKNAGGSAKDGGIGAAGRNAGLDFAVVEECGRYSECQVYQRLYADRMVDVEYTDKGFDAACRAVGARIAVVRRDEDVTPEGPFESC